MPPEPAVLSALLECVRRALRAASAGREEAVLVERTCATGSLARGTYAVGSEAIGLVLFLNIDLQFGQYETSQSLDAMAAALRSGLALDGWSFELQVMDAECRGGVWAALRCRRHSSGEAPATPSPAAGTEGSKGAGEGSSDVAQDRGGAGLAASRQDDVILQLILAENMTGSVTSRVSQAEEGEEAAGAAGGAAGAGEPRGVPGEELLGLGPMREDKALEQQRNLLAAAEHRARREARHQARHGGAAATAWVARLGHGVAEARRVFWSRQPEAARRAARAAHLAWSLVAEAAEQGQEERQHGDAAAPGGSGDRGAAPGGFGAVSALWSDEMMHLMDVLALHAYWEAHGQPQATPAGEGPVGRSQGAAEDGRVVSRLFGLLSTDDGSSGFGLRVAVQGGLLAAPPSVADAPADTGEADGKKRVVGDAEGQLLVVTDPCFPVQDLYAAACKVVGQDEGAVAGQRRLQRLAAAAVVAAKKSQVAA